MAERKDSRVRAVRVERTRRVRRDARARDAELPAKVTRPSLPEVTARPRLLRVLDQAALDAACIWIEGPPGAGKTTLALQWIEASRRPCVFYRVDPGDADMATLCHYLSLAITRVERRAAPPLPRLTHEYGGELETFTRRYFEALSARVPKNTLFVFDDLHDLEHGSALHEALRVALTAIPRGQHLLCISRSAPPVRFARSKLHGQIAELRWDALRLTREEALEIAARRGVETKRLALSLHEKAQGWITGLLLMLEAPARKVELSFGRGRAQLLFDYFAAEIFARLSDSARELLLKTAFLPEVTGEAARALTGEPGAEKLLQRLVEKNHFILERPGDEARYEYHPLFRAFLKATAERQWAPSALRRSKQSAAALLAKGDRFEDAAALYREIGDYAALAALIGKEAPTLLAQGRYHALREWLDALPSRSVEKDAWLSYFHGAARLLFDPRAAEPFFINAHRRFRRARNGEGLFLAWCGIADAIWNPQRDFARIAPWLAVLDEDMAAHEPALENPNALGRVAGSVLWALLWGSFEQPRLSRWIERGAALLSRVTDLPTRLRLGTAILHYYGLTARQSEAAVLSETLSALVEESGAPPGAALQCRLAQMMWLAHVGPPERAIEHLAQTRRLADESGIHMFDTTLFGLGAWGLLSLGDLETVKPLLREMARLLAPLPVNLDSALLHFDEAWRLRLEGRSGAAVRHAKLSVRIAEETGAYMPTLFCVHMLAHAHLERGEVTSAREQSELGLERAKKGQLETLVALFELSLARVAFSEAHGEALAHLQRGLSLLAGTEFLGYLPGWRREDVSELYARALEHGIAAELVRRAIRASNLAPPRSSSAADSWPMPVRIQAFGRFTVLLQDEALTFSGKTQRKPLELLKALIAFGGRDVREERISDALWPDAEADDAARALTTTLHRLRKLVGDATLVRRDSLLSLDPSQCWVDVWAFERDANALGRGLHRLPLAELARYAERLAVLYRGPFLAEDEQAWALERRRRLTRRFVVLLEQLGERSRSSGDYALAREYFERARESAAEEER